MIGKNNALISIFAGSRVSEINILMPILLNFIKLMQEKYKDITYVFHTTRKHNDLIKSYIKNSSLKNCEVLSDEKLKNHILKRSIFAVAKSGTISLEICNAKIPSIIIYKMNFINYYLAKFFLKINFINMINIINNKEVIPELIQTECNSEEIYRSVIYFLKKPELIEAQLAQIKSTINDLKSSTSSADQASDVILSYLS